MATTVGESVHSDELMAAQFDDIAEGTAVESFAIEFEEYLSSSSSSGSASRKCYRVARMVQSQVAKMTMSESSARAGAGGSVSPEAVEADQKAKHECEVPNSGELRQSGEPTYSGGFRSIGQVFNLGELRESGGLRFIGQVPNSGELRKSDEPIYSGGLRSIGQIPNFGELHQSSEPTYSGGLRSIGQISSSGELHQARLTAQLRPQTDLCQKGKASGSQIGALHQARPTGEPHQAEPRQHTCTQTGVAFPSGCTRSEPVSDDDDGYCSAVATSQTSSSIQGRSVGVYMTDILDEIPRRLDEQQATINSMKEMMEQLLSEKRKKKRRASRASRKSSKHKERAPTPPHTSSESSSKSSEGASSSGHNPRDKRFDELQSQLNALKLQEHMNKLGVVRPYPTEWDTVSYPAKFEPLDLLQFDGKGSPTQHIYYFQTQTGHIMGNDPIMTRLFIGTLKGVAFEWFRRLEPGSITCWKDMERLFMARFFDDDTGVSMTTLLAAKQRETESVSNFVKRFRNRSLRARDQISEATLIEMCRNNLSINILSNMGAVIAHSWKDLTRQGEQVENMLKRMEAEEPFEFQGGDDQDTLVVATTSSSKLFSNQRGDASKQNKPLMASSDLANSEPSYGTDGEDLATIGQR